MPNFISKHIPNAITCANLFCGCIGIVFAFKGDLSTAATAVFLSAIFDFFDGFAARLLRAYSAIGKELDSLADIVSFGLLPSVIIYEFFLKAVQLTNSDSRLSYFAFIIPVFSAIRLAKFNIDERQTDNFIGLPTPACAILIASFPFILTRYTGTINAVFYNPYILVCFCLLISLLMVVEIPMLSLKFKNYGVVPNIFRYLLLLISAIMIGFLNFAAIPLIIFIYIVLSIIQFKFVSSKL